MARSKYILASGCSFTDPNFDSLGYTDKDVSFPKWPSVLGSMLGVDNVVNLGKQGSCNHGIITRAIDHIIHEEKPWLVVIGLSEITRLTPDDWYNINPIYVGRIPYKPKDWMALFELDEWAKTFVSQGEWLISRDETNDLGIMRGMFVNYIKQINRIVGLCHKLNIKIILGSLLWPLNPDDYNEYRAFHNLPDDHGWTWESIAKLFMDCEGFDDVDPKTFIRWPVYPQLGGGMLCSDEEGFSQEEEGPSSMILGPLDYHPNALGHQHIAEKFYEHYKKTY